MTKAEAVIAEAESRYGCPYVYGTWGQLCTTALRKRYARYNPSQKAVTYRRCPVLSGKAKSCAGCKYQGLLAYDCRGFTHWCLKTAAGIDITGGYVLRQWTDPNWDEKGTIDQMPDLVCCVFVKKGSSWKHTGLHIGGGRIIHCSGEVKTDTVGGDNAWTHYAVPKGLYTDEERRAARKEQKIMRTLKKGCQGEDVRAVQEMLAALGYDCGAPDGIYGAKTAAAVRSFQTEKKLQADGIAGGETLAALAAAAAGPKDETAPAEDPPAITDTILVEVRALLKRALELLNK